MIELSSNTKRLLNVVIPAESREKITNRLIEEVSENIPFQENNNPIGMERIRFSILRLMTEGKMEEDEVFELAYIDWRDLFVAAGNEIPGEHEKWANQAIKRATRQDGEP